MEWKQNFMLPLDDLLSLRDADVSRKGAFPSAIKVKRFRKGLKYMH
jgi:hypothetical protein